MRMPRIVGHRCERLLVCATLLAATLLATSREVCAGGFGHFISPVSNPTNFEDPRIVTDVRPIFAYHDIDDDFLDVVEAAGLKAPDGSAQVVALQIRLKLTDRLALIATKDGYVWLNPDDELDNVVKDSNGFANIAGGLKYNFFRDLELPALATAGLRYEGPSGEPQAHQGSVFRTHNALGLDLHSRGAGVMNLFLSGAWGYENLHVLGYTGPRIALNDTDSSFYDLSLHADYQFDTFYPLIELNWIHVLNGGDRLEPLEDAGLEIDEEGFDFFNFGAPSAGGTGVVTMAFGARWRLVQGLETPAGTGGLDFGAVAEIPVTSRHDLFGWRVTTDLIFWLS